MPKPERFSPSHARASARVYHLGCCYAAPGYDTASGMGSIRFDVLAGCY